MNINKINYMYFILSVLVILIHSINNETFFQRLFSIDNGIGQFAVPLFFVISGFLYFRNVVSIHDIPKKIQKRIYTLLIPFLIWNLIYYIIHLILKPENGFSLARLMDAMLNYTYNPSFWFLFQLILLVAITPIIYYVISKDYFFFLWIIFISLLIMFHIDIPFINEDAIIYFSIGSYFSKLYNKGKIFLVDKKAFVITLVITIGLFMINRFVYGLCAIDYQKYNSIFTLSIIFLRVSGAFLIFYLCDIIFMYDKLPEFMKNTFFLYAIHYMIVKFLIIITHYFTYKYLNITLTTIIENIVFVISPIVCIVINYYLSRFLIRKIPKVYSFITGDRR